MQTFTMSVKMNGNEQLLFTDERIVGLGGNKWLLKLLNKTLYIKKEAVLKSSLRSGGVERISKI